MNERKQAFNAYKTQRQKEEKEGQRLRAKKAKEDLEEYLMNNPRMTSLTKYYRCEEMYGVLDVSELAFESFSRLVGSLYIQSAIIILCELRCGKM